MPRPVKRLLEALVNTGVDLSTLTASGAELNILDGASLDVNELNILDGVTATYTDLNRISSLGDAAAIGAVAGSGVTCVITRFGGGFFKLDFTLVAVAITHTDAAGSGSSGSIKIFDFVQGAIMPLGSRSNLVFTGDALIDTNAGDMAFVYGLGSVAANAGDAALTSTEVDFAAVSGTITLSAKSATSATLLKGVGTAVDGTSTASDLYLNESGSIATSDANGVLTVDGTITLIGCFLGDD